MKNEGTLDRASQAMDDATTPADAGAAPERWTRLRRWRSTALAAALGAGAAGAYAHFIGCKTGTCPITSNVWVSSAYGGLVGVFVAWPARRGRG